MPNGGPSGRSNIQEPVRVKEDQVALVQRHRTAGQKGHLRRNREGQTGADEACFDVARRVKDDDRPDDLH